MAKHRILSFDGGGIRGLVTCVLLERLEAAQPGWLAKADLLAGTSTGGIIALGLAKGLSPAELRALYETNGEDIFDDSWLDNLLDLGSVIGAEYDNRKLTKLLKQKLGATTTLGQLGKKVLIPAFDLDNEDPVGRTWKPKLFHNVPGTDKDNAELAYKIALYTSAAPTYFPTVDGYVDGGVYANNPTMCAVTQALDERNTKTVELKDIVTLSLGTGTSLEFVAGKDLDWGYAQWVKPLISLMMDGAMGVADYQAHQLLGKRYHRFAPHFPPGEQFKMDDVEKIPEMIAFANAVDLTETANWIGANW